MAPKGTLAWLCTLAVLTFSAAQDDVLTQNCDSQTQLWEKLSADLKVAAECSEDLPSVLSGNQTASLMLSMRNMIGLLHKQQLRECHGAEPKICPEAEVPQNGGLACVTLANKRYCKPMCNFGYDFGFLRRSRVFEECSEQTGHKWHTHYVGGNKLAVCNEASIQVSGAASAYFPKDQDCLTTKSSSQLQNNVIEIFTAELKNQDIEGEPESGCLVCGRP